VDDDGARYVLNEDDETNDKWNGPAYVVCLIFELYTHDGVSMPQIRDHLAEHHY
jgi:hypothetical protein